MAVHCASHCFRNSPKYTSLVGGRFAHHETGVFRSRIIDAQHPAMRGVKSFESWDETYVHNELSKRSTRADGAPRTMTPTSPTHGFATRGKDASTTRPLGTTSAPAACPNFASCSPRRCAGARVAATTTCRRRSSSKRAKGSRTTSPVRNGAPKGIG